MAHVGQIHEVLEGAVQAAHEGVQYVEMGEAEREQVVAMYAGFTAAVEGVISTAGDIIAHLGKTTEYAQVGGEKISEGVQGLQTLGTDNSTVHAAVRHYRAAASVACGEGSMVTSVAVQTEALGEIIADMGRVKRYIETLTLLATDDAKTKGVHVHVVQGDRQIQEYAQQIGVPPPTTVQP